MKIASTRLLYFFAAVAQSAFAAAPPAKPADQGAHTSAAAPAEKGPLLRARSATESLLTSAQGHHYRILVSAPAGAAPKDGFPVFYVLDADAWFGTTVEIAKMREYEKLEPAVIIGVASPKHFFFNLSRSYDFTPPGADPDFDGVKTGGANEFLAFLNDRLKPWVRAKYKIDPNRQILFGHSLGGTFALHTLFTAPESFSIYLIASPHIFFAGKAALKNESAFEASAARPNVRVLITDGTLENHSNPELVDDYRRYFSGHPESHAGQTADEAVNDLFADHAETDKLAETRALVGRLTSAGVKAVYAEFPGEEHMSAAISALNRGVPFALRPAR
jgi:uncharacterized protein